jgi:hypothetical protein
MFPYATLRHKEKATRLPFSGKGAHASQHQDHPSRLIESRARTRRTGDHDTASTHRVRKRRGDITPNDDEALPQSSRGAIGGRSETDDRQPRRIQLGCQLGACSPVHFDDGRPGASKSSGDEPLPLRPQEADPLVALVESSGQLGIDALIVANLGNGDSRDLWQRPGCRFGITVHQERLPAAS